MAFRDFLTKYADAINQGFVNSGSSLPYPIQPSTPSNSGMGVFSDIGNALTTGVHTLKDLGSNLVSSKSSLTGNEPIARPVSAGGVSRGTVPSSTIDYLNADLAKHYGLGKTTAYQEALSNTAYQRAVADMKAAGLNPAAIFGSGKGYTAGGVSYVSEPSSSSGGGATNNDYLFSEGMYHAISTAAGLVGAAITKLPTGYWIGQSTAQGVLGALNSMFK